MWSSRGKPETLQDVVKEYKSNGPIGSRSTLSCEHLVHHYRRMVPQILDTLEFRSNNDIHRPVISALELQKSTKVVPSTLLI